MTSYSIILKPVYSCPASDVPSNIQLPQNWSLAWHQLATWQALNDPDVDVIVNSSMTGDGKSLAAYLDSLQEKEDFRYAMGLYPTNELARDQDSQIQHYIQQFNPNNDPRVSRLSSATLEIYAESEKISKATTIQTRIDQSEIILTNPDILHYLHRNAYLTPKDRPDKLWSSLDTKFQLLIYDEFHVLSAPQIGSVINTMLLMRHTNRPRKHLFLSATPEKQLIERLQKIGFSCQEINPYEEEKYKFPDFSEESQQLQSQGWRQVARKITLQFIPLDSSYKVAENWLWENRESIKSYFQQYPGSKGAIILNSIASVKRLKPLLKEFLYPLIVAENTGLTGQLDKEHSLEADLVLGTSTIDVGVDFKINFLIFESADAGSFIQRLGRLGRHDDYEKEGEKIQFTNFTAYALTSQFLVERLFQGDNPPLENQKIYDRPFFHQQIRDKYRKINNFQEYYRRWAGVQSVSISYALGHKTIKEQYKGSREAFEEDCKNVFDTSLGRVKVCLEKWREEWQQLSGQVSKSPIEEDASSFRGSSPLLCGLYEEEEHEVDSFKTYDLPGILSNIDIEPMTKTDYMKRLELTEVRCNQPIPKRRFNYCLAFMKVQRYREERLNWRFSYTGDLGALADSYKVQVLLGIQVYQPGNRWINEVNKRLKGRALVTFILRHSVEEVKKRLQLPIHFKIYAIDESGRDNLTAPYSIAFGQSALLLDTLAYRLKSKGGETWIC